MNGRRMIGLARVPRDVHRLLVEASANATAAAGCLQRLLHSRDPGLVEELERREQDGDRIIHDLLHRIEQTSLRAP